MGTTFVMTPSLLSVTLLTFGALVILLFIKTSGEPLQFSKITLSGGVKCNAFSFE